MPLFSFLLLLTITFFSPLHHYSPPYAIGTQMVLTMKLTSFAYNLYDGTADKKKVFAVHEDKKNAKIYADRK
jgi:hypothetical protein